MRWTPTEVSLTLNPSRVITTLGFVGKDRDEKTIISIVFFLDGVCWNT
jgi:hypothetical protein